MKVFRRLCQINYNEKNPTNVYDLFNEQGEHFCILRQYSYNISALFSVTANTINGINGDKTPHVFIESW